MYFIKTSFLIVKNTLIIDLYQGILLIQLLFS